jgi:hypothetical protein
LGIGKKKVILCPIKPANTMKIRLFGAVLGIEENKETPCPNILIVLGIGKEIVILCPDTSRYIYGFLSECPLRK